MEFNYRLLDVSVGPFAPLVGYIGALLATVFIIRVMVWGKRQIWNTPENTLPKTLSRLVAIVVGVVIVLLWLDAAPTNIREYSKVAIIFIVIAITTYFLYHFFINKWTYSKTTTSDPKTILGGVTLKKTASDIKYQRQLTTQDLFAGAAYDVNQLWSEASLSLSKIILMALFLAVMACGTLAICTAGFLIQVKLTNKPAAEIIKKAQAPGLEEVNQEKDNIHLNK